MENTLLDVSLLTCYIGRSNYIKRIIACFLAQEYEGNITLVLYNNGYSLHQLSTLELPYNRHIQLINNHIDYETFKEYTNTGAIFRDAVSYISTDVLSFFDSDDLFLPNHVSEGVKGYLEAKANNQLAYKPKYSHHIYIDKYELSNNNMEPSIFVNTEYIKNTGFAPVSSSYHQQWLTPLQQNKLILEKEKGISTFLYDWSRGHNTFKISGAGDDSEVNFKNHRNWESKAIEEHILSPISREQLNRQYEKIANNSLCNK